MTALALSRLPYWRWWRATRRRRQGNRPGAAVKPWNGIVALIGLLVALDQLVKYVLVTPDWAWHVQPTSWLINPLIFTATLSPLLLVPAARRAASFAIAGAVGNALSELTTPAIANPFVAQIRDSTFAFNLADAYLATGVILAILAVPAIVTARPRRHP